jgi:hypothetical protein
MIKQHCPSPFFMAGEIPRTRQCTLIDVGLSAHQYYIQFVPPATFGVIYDRSKRSIHLVRANSERILLRRTSDKIYVLRGFVGLRRRERRDVTLFSGIEDEIIRTIVSSFEKLEKLRTAVWKYCPLLENARIITDIWGQDVFWHEVQGICFFNMAHE